MASMEVSAESTRRTLVGSRKGRFGDTVLRSTTLAATVGTAVLIILIVYKVVEQARLSLGEFGLGFITSQDWDVVRNQFGALDFIFGTAITSLAALLIATPIAIAIGLFLTELAPNAIRTPLGALIETLAGIPSVVIGLWGILVMGPAIQKYIGPGLAAAFGWTPFFPKQDVYQSAGVLAAILVLVIMTVPIVSSLARELLTRVPRDLKDGSYALGATQWETTRRVTIPYVGPGLLAAAVLGLGRALGEAIAVTQVIGTTAGIQWSFFATGDTLASRIASQYQGAVSNIQVSSLAYLALILLVLSLVFNGLALTIVRWVEKKRA
jgi:phosphate transport system permease protein